MRAQALLGPHSAIVVMSRNCLVWSEGIFGGSRFLLRRLLWGKELSVEVVNSLRVAGCDPDEYLNTAQPESA